MPADAKQNMFWADQIARSAAATGKPQVVNDSKTPSGRVHVGALRGVLIHDVIHKALQDAGVKSVFYYGNDDFDPMDSLPAYLPKEKFAQYMGKPLCDIPAPDGSNKNYADYYFDEFRGVCEALGVKPEAYKMSALYKSGKLNDFIKQVLENAETIRGIYARVSGSEKGGEWLPFSVVCENCGKIGTTRAFAFDGKRVKYKCEPAMVEWAKGCGFEGERSPFDGGGKLPWKLEWVAQWIYHGVTIEGAGKDHSTAGGARDVSNAITHEVFKREPPLEIPYEFFLIGGRKMSSSKGLGASAREVSEMIPPELLRFLMVRYKPSTAIDFNPEGETISRLFDAFDEAAAVYFKDKEARDPDVPRIYALSQVGAPKKTFVPQFSFVAALIQVPGVDVKKAVEKHKGSALTKEEERALEERVSYAGQWLEKFAPEEARIRVLEDARPQFAELSVAQKKALSEFAEFFARSDDDQNAQAEKIKEAAAANGLSLNEFFEAAYLVLIARKRGPRLLPFLNALDKNFVEKRLTGAI